MKLENNKKKGHGYWKLNSKLLELPEFEMMVRQNALECLFYIYCTKERVKGWSMIRPPLRISLLRVYIQIIDTLMMES